MLSFKNPSFASYSDVKKSFSFQHCTLCIYLLTLQYQHIYSFYCSSSQCYFKEIFAYFRRQCFIRYFFCKYFLLLCALSSHSLETAILAVTAFEGYASLFVHKNSRPCPRSSRFSHLSSLRRIRILCFTCRSVILFQFILVKAIKSVSRFHFFFFDM